jgi:DNA-binding NtrC family response regulator
MRSVHAALNCAAPTQAPVLLLGESGTGKELAARALHSASQRADKPFEVVDCGGLSPTLVESELFGHERGSFTGADRERAGAFERADGGTLFLDELGELPAEVQPKLLRALGEREIRRVGGSRSRRVDVRIVAATNRDLAHEVRRGAFRADLFFRLAVIQVRMPPLRARLEDLPSLVRALMKSIEPDVGSLAGLDVDIEALSRYHWPGNVRELRNYLQQLAVLRVAPPLDVPTGAEDGFSRLPLHEAREQFERAYLRACLDEARGNVAEAATRAGINRTTMYRSIQRHGLR